MLISQGGKRSGNIDVWWLYDDGGLTLLLPYILTTRQQFSECKLRVFTLANRKDELDRETRNMAALLAKFRIEFSSVVVIPDVTKRASDSTRARLDTLLGKIPKDTIPEEELLANKEKTNRHLRLAELLQGHSKDSEIIVMTLPMPRKGNVSSALYMAWLDIMTENLPPTLLIRYVIMCEVVELIICFVSGGIRQVFLHSTARQLQAWYQCNLLS